MDAAAGETTSTFARSRAATALFAIAALVILLAFLGHPAVQRTQESRVLETGREMLGRGWRDWLIPHLNGNVRLEKPPLAYWMAAAAFKLGGVSEGVGRLPFAFIGWLTAMLVAAMARWMFDRGAAFFSAAALIGCMMFARHARLAETDIVATFFVTAAIACILRGMHGGGKMNWYRVSGVMIGLAVMGKGLPALFALAFLLALLIARPREDWRVLWDWTRSGAPLLTAIVSVPWFAYVQATVGLSKLQEEAEIGVKGAEHAASFLQYFPDVLRAVAPWTAIVVLALIVAGYHWRRDWRARSLLLWFGAIFVPLLCAKQRQFHYLLPALPPLAIACGWIMSQALDRAFEHHRLVRALLLWTLILAAVGSFGLPIIAAKLRGGRTTIDWVATAVGVGVCLVALPFYANARRFGGAFAIASIVAVTMLVQVWMPSLRPNDPRAIAAQIRALGEGPYYFYGSNISLPLVFHMREVMPQLTTPQDLAAAAASHPTMILVAQSKSGTTPPPVPRGFRRATEITSDEQTFEIYRLGETPDVADHR